ncbi:MAG: hypothetical protein V2A61_01655, partial [Calditrichota bacterium]
MNGFRNISLALSIVVATLETLTAQESHNIANLAYIGSVSWQNATSVALSGNLAFVLDEGTGVHIVDISRPRSPRPIADYIYNGSALDLTVAGRICWIAGGESGRSSRGGSTPERR